MGLGIGFAVGEAIARNPRMVFKALWVTLLLCVGMGALVFAGSVVYELVHVPTVEEKEQAARAENLVALRKSCTSESALTALEKAYVRTSWALGYGTFVGSKVSQLQFERMLDQSRDNARSNATARCSARLSGYVQSNEQSFDFIYDASAADSGIAFTIYKPGAWASGGERSYDLIPLTQGASQREPETRAVSNTTQARDETQWMRLQKICTDKGSIGEIAEKIGAFPSRRKNGYVERNFRLDSIAFQSVDTQTRVVTCVGRIIGDKYPVVAGIKYGQYRVEYDFRVQGILLAGEINYNLSARGW